MAVSKKGYKLIHHYNSIAMNPKPSLPDEHVFESLDMDVESFRKLGYEMIDIISNYYTTIRDRSITSKSNSQQIAATFQENLPVEPQAASEILHAWESRILPHATHLGSPRYFGFVNGSGSMMSVFAAALASSVNMNTGGWKAGPAATEIERRSIAWLAELIGYEPSCGGLFVGGGTIANFAALLTALRYKQGINGGAHGLQTISGGDYVVYMSDHEGHISIVKSVEMLNLGRKSIRRVPSNDDLSMNTDALKTMIAADLAAGHHPFCVVAQVGSINVGIIDDLEGIARICKENNLWMHADGACGAVGAMLPELEPFYRGLDKADSITLDPHKWLYISYECGCLLVRDPEILKQTFSMSAAYLQGILPTDYQGMDYFDYGPQMSRGFNALKMWMTLKHYGKKGYQQLLRQNIACARHLHQLVSASDNFIPMHEPQLFIYAFQYFPSLYKNQSPSPELHAHIDKLNQQLADAITATGLAFIMTSKIKGRIVIRMSICSHRTTLQDIEMVFNNLDTLSQSILTAFPL